jgi:hypothetical protein
MTLAPAIRGVAASATTRWTASPSATGSNARIVAIVWIWLPQV